jgi:hypothetical protein
VSRRRSPKVSVRPIVLKNSILVRFTRFSGVALPLTDARERFVGRSERSIFSPGGLRAACCEFFNTIDPKRPVESPKSGLEVPALSADFDSCLR